VYDQFFYISPNLIFSKLNNVIIPFIIFDVRNIIICTLKSNFIKEKVYNYICLYEYTYLRIFIHILVTSMFLYKGYVFLSSKNVDLDMEKTRETHNLMFIHIYTYLCMKIFLPNKSLCSLLFKFFCLS